MMKPNITVTINCTKLKPKNIATPNPPNAAAKKMIWNIMTYVYAYMITRNSDTSAIFKNKTLTIMLMTVVKMAVPAVTTIKKANSHDVYFMPIDF